ncbi:hypothetical protein RV13_GL002394 [Enterococcus raffinosus]|nr:hypothetical protein RV13_GL002394 [Enterococcus raffinosus]
MKRSFKKINHFPIVFGTLFLFILKGFKTIVSVAMMISRSSPALFFYPSIHFD